MIELATIRENPERVRQAIRDLNTTAPIDEILELDARRRALLTELETQRAERNRVSKEIPTIKEEATKTELIRQMRALGDDIRIADDELAPI